MQVTQVIDKEERLQYLRGLTLTYVDGVCCINPLYENIIQSLVHASLISQYTSIAIETAYDGSQSERKAGRRLVKVEADNLNLNPPLLKFHLKTRK